jgi:type IV fimbrial biogenesis protein FimT
MQNKTGFTLMELMVTMAIIALIAAIAVPNFIGWLPRHRLSTSTRDVYNAVQTAKLRAVRENAPTVMTFNAGNGSYAVFLDNGDGTADADADGIPDGFNDGIRNGTESTLLQEQLASDVQIAAANTIRFNARGFPAAQVNVVLASTATNGGQRTVGITAAGSISVTNP